MSEHRHQWESHPTFARCECGEIRVVGAPEGVQTVVASERCPEKQSGHQCVRLLGHRGYHQAIPGDGSQLHWGIVPPDAAPSPEGVQPEEELGNE